MNTYQYFRDVPKMKSSATCSITGPLLCNLLTDLSFLSFAVMQPLTSSFVSMNQSLATTSTYHALLNVCDFQAIIYAHFKAYAAYLLKTVIIEKELGG